MSVCTCVHLYVAMHICMKHYIVTIMLIQHYNIAT